MTEDHDDLDRALFALPLATPPADLRAAILRSTIYSPSAAHACAIVAPFAFAARDIAFIGAAIAVAVWLVVYAIFDPSFVSHAAANTGALVRSLLETQTLAWLAAGASIALVANDTGRLRLPRAAHRDEA